jgi:hypothetical protein
MQDSIDSVCDGDDSAIMEGSFYRFLNFLLSLDIDIGCCLINQHDFTFL